MFCAGADLKAAGTPAGNRVAPDGDGPMGPTRMRLSKPVIAAVRVTPSPAGSSSRCGATCGSPSEDAVFGVFCRRWGVPLIDGGTVRLPRLIGVEPGDGHGADGTRGRRRARRWRSAWPTGSCRRAQAREAAEELARELARFPQTCMREDRLSLLESEGLDRGAPRSPTSSSTGCGR